MTNLLKSFIAEAKRREDILRFAVVGYDDRLSVNADRNYGKAYSVEHWDSAAQKINYDYDSGYGGADCHAVIAWGDRFVYSVNEYDGATCVQSIPRNPENCAPGWGYSE